MSRSSMPFQAWNGCNENRGNRSMERSSRSTCKKSMKNIARSNRSTGTAFREFRHSGRELLALPTAVPFQSSPRGWNGGTIERFGGGSISECGAGYRAAMKCDGMAMAAMSEVCLPFAAEGEQ